MKKHSIKGVAWDSMFLAFAKIVTLLFGIISTKILSTGLSLSEYGTYAEANIINSLGASLLLMGTPDALNYFYNKQDEKTDNDTKSRIINTIFFIELILGILFFVKRFFASISVVPNCAKESSLEMKFLPLV